jgi:predicted SAM-dependent methyltransferase
MQMIMKTVMAAMHRLGYELTPTDKGPKTPTSDGPDPLALQKECSNTLRRLGVTKAHYGCGMRLLRNDWLNIDRSSIHLGSEELYVSCDLVSKHPFPSNYFSFSFAEDFLEHLTQDESIVFLSESFRCLRTGGVIRLSFPGLRGVLRRHYRSSNYNGASVGREEAFTLWEHKHFYCEESLSIVARHIGFSDIKFLQYGVSVYEELQNLDYRADQQDLNIYAELTK